MFPFGPVKEKLKDLRWFAYTKMPTDPTQIENYIFSLSSMNVYNLLAFL